MPPDLRIEWGEGAPPDAFAAAAPAGSAPEPLDSDARWAVMFSNGMPVARLATYLRRDLSGAPGTSGLIGHYAALDSASGVALLREAAARVRAEGASRVLGPMNGSTWSRYRLALPAQEGDPVEPPFLGEPVNPPGYAAHFLDAGCSVAALYESRIAYDVGAANPRAGAAETALARRGIGITPLDMTRFEDELRDLHAMSIRAFPENRYYAPIDAASFGALYRPMRGLIDPDLVLLARSADGNLIAYVFAYVDPMGLRDGRPYRLIVKTLATDPDWRGAGLGAVLVERLHAAARGKGLSAIVHALMHAGNNSVKISAHTAQVFRRYALFEFPSRDGR